MREILFYNHQSKLTWRLSTFIYTIIIAAVIAGWALPTSAQSAFVRVNQVGYVASGAKRAYLMTSSSSGGASFTVVNSSNVPVFSAAIGADLGSWGSFSHVFALDFDSVTTTGTYTINIDGSISAASPNFQIATGANLYSTALANTLYFYENERDGANFIPTPLRTAAGHLNDATAKAYLTPHMNKNGRFSGDLTPTGAVIDASGGWWDAGDYLKFVQTHSYTVALMVIGVRDFPNQMGASSAASNFTAEAKFGLDWLQKMWDDSSKTFYYQVGIGNGNSGTISDHDIWRLPQAVDTSQGASWNGVIAPARAIDWSQAGLPGSNLPDASWPICQTISPYSGSVATITTALLNCQTAHPTGGVVVLAAGTFTLSGGTITFPGNGHVAVRGAGANATQLNFTTGSTLGGFFDARGDGNTFTGNSQPGSTQHVVQVTSGQFKGSTQLILSGLDTIVVGSVLVLNQCDTGFTGTGLGAACVGVANDNGGYFHCQDAWRAPNNGCAVPSEGGINSWRLHSSEMEAAVVTAINQNGCGATCVTLSKPIEQPDWGSDTQAVIIRVNPFVGIENLSINDVTGLTQQTGVNFFNVLHGWVSGVRGNAISRLGVELADCMGCLVKDSYFFGNPTFHDASGIRAVGGANNLIQNNIFHKNAVSLFSADAVLEQGDVIAYNYSPDANNYASPNIIGAVQFHGAGSDFNLMEGNSMPYTQNDGDHGSHLSQTYFRNFIWSYTQCTNGQCGPGVQPTSGSNYTAVTIFYGSRYHNYVGNVLGTLGWSSTYKNSSVFTSHLIFNFGAGQPMNVSAGQGQPPSPSTTFYSMPTQDALVPTTTLLWGNYDTVTGATRFCGNSSDTGWSTTCASTSEVPTGAPSYPNAVPTLGDTGAGQAPMPASFYLSSKPSWFGSIPWPPIGPDVSSGNVGQCTGTLNTAGQYAKLPATSGSQCTGTSLTTAWAGHVNANPAMACYFSMGGNLDGTSGILTFDPSACYGSGGSSPPPTDTTPPSMPTNLFATAASASQINLSWSASTDNVAVTGYKIFRCQGSGCTPTAQITTTATNSYQNTGLAAGTTYVYKVSAYDAAGNNSSQSASASAATKAGTSAQSVTSFTLYNTTNAAATTVIQTITNNSTLTLSGLPKSLGMTANTSPATVGSVVFSISQTGYSHTETIAPYAVCADGGSASTIHACPFLTTPGTYTLTATPWSAAGGTGTAGTPKTVTLTVVSGTSAGTANSVLNPSFESGLANWTKAGNGTGVAVNNSANAHSGSYYAELTSASGQQPLLFSTYIPVTPGQTITFGGWVYRVSGNGAAQYVLEITDANKANASYTGGTNVTAASWTNVSNTYTVPTGKAYVRLYMQIYQNTVTSDARFDDVTMTVK